MNNWEYIKIYREHGFEQEVKSMVSVGNDLWVATTDGSIYRITNEEPSKFKRFIKKLFRIR